MKFKASILYSYIILFIAVLSLFTDWYQFLVSSLMATLIVMLLDKLGKGIVLREATAVFYTLTCLVMPLIGYSFYTLDNPLASLWVKYMRVAEDNYFSFVLPAVAFFSLAITAPLSVSSEADRGYALKQLVERAKEKLKLSRNVGIYIMITGVVISFFITRLPENLQFFASLFLFASFAGLLYVFYSPAYKYKKLVIFLFICFIISNALSSGMFTIVAYMGITIFSFLYFGGRTNLFKKLMILGMAMLFFLVLQNTKRVYRSYTWKSQYTGNKALLFGELFMEEIQQGHGLIEKDAFFPIYVRINQGYNISLVIRRIPGLVPHDDGKNLFRNFASALVPRFLWPDKPQAGGKFNMKYYAGRTIKGWSTNVGPVGEAYGSFGKYGGIFYMFLLGLFVRFVYGKVFKIAQRNPVLVCWLPVLFYQVTYSAETDTLQIMNSIFKIAFFIWLLTKIIPGWFPGLKNTKHNSIRNRNLPAFQ